MSGLLGQSVVEYSVLVALLLVATVVFWQRISRTLPGQMTLGLQKAVNCMADYRARCR